MEKKGTLAVSTLFSVLATIATAQGVFEKRVSPVAPNQTQTLRTQVNVALLVGISKYPDASGFTPLHYAAADASDLAALLRQQGYLVRVLTDTDAMRGSIEQSISDLAANLDEKSGGTFLFYFSGHGFAQQGKNYLVPSSASVSTLERDGLPVEDVEKLMAKSKARRQLMLLDACRSDESSGTKGLAARSFSALQAAEGLRILNSSQIGRVSYESQDLRHGVFTAFLLKGLTGEAAGSDGLVTFSDLAGYVTDSVRRWSNDHTKVQVPYEAVGQNEASGDFLLARVTAHAAQVVLPPIANPTPNHPSYTPSLPPPVHPSPATGQLNVSSISAEADQFYEQKNYARAFPLYQQAAQARDAHAMAGLGMLYYMGWGTPRNYEEAGRYLQQAADLGQTSIVNLLGTMYVMGQGVPQNDLLGAKWSRKAADLGDASSMYLLGFLYENGRGVPKDLNQAVAWYRKSAAQGYLKATMKLQAMGLMR